MPKVKLCGYLIGIDSFNQHRIKFCDDIDDRCNTKYKINMLKKTGGDNPIRDDHFIVKSKHIEKKLIGSLVEIVCGFRRYAFENKFGWSLDLVSIEAVSTESRHGEEAF